MTCSNNQHFVCKNNDKELSFLFVDFSMCLDWLLFILWLQFIPADYEVLYPIQHGINVEHVLVFYCKFLGLLADPES